MDWIILNIDGIFRVVTGVISFAAAVAALFPKATGANVVITKIRSAVDLLALNFGHAKNQDS